MSFEDLGLSPVLLKALTDSGYENPTDVQARAIPVGLQGKDLMVSSSTGSGKTASFILPALERVLASRSLPRPPRGAGPTGPRVLVLAPTRELALQVSKAASTYGHHVPYLRVATIVGGVPYAAQLKALRGPLDILIATPGRLIDHLGAGKAVLDNVELLVLDEADRMLDMGFIEDIEHISASLPASRQTVMYSATFAGHVGRLAQQLLRDPQRIDVASHTDTHANIEQRLHWADSGHHKNALLDHILTEREVGQAVVFTSTQRDADWLAQRLADMGHAAAPLHGGMPQGRRNRTLMGLRRGDLRVLVATDVAARGIDVPTITHVINYGMPLKAEDYVHRIGRTGRAGRSGLAVTLAERADSGMIRRIQHFTTQRIPVATIAGLEPKSPEPQLNKGPIGRSDARFGDRRPAPGKRPGGQPFHKGARGDGERSYPPRGDWERPAPSFRPDGDRGHQAPRGEWARPAHGHAAPGQHGERQERDGREFRGQHQAGAFDAPRSPARHGSGADARRGPGFDRAAPQGDRRARPASRSEGPAGPGRFRSERSR